MCSFEGAILQYSSIAQLVEHAAVNRAVVGSSPTRGVNCSIADFAIEFFIYASSGKNLQSVFLVAAKIP